MTDLFNYRPQPPVPKKPSMVERMNEIVRDDWVMALLMGEYVQGGPYLFDGQRYSANGVLCDLARKAGIGRWEIYGKGNHWRFMVNGPTLDTSDYILPYAVGEWAGIKRVDPIIQYKGVDTSVSRLASQFKLGFDEIANHIQEQL